MKKKYRFLGRTGQRNRTKNYCSRFVYLDYQKWYKKKDLSSKEFRKLINENYLEFSQYKLLSENLDAIIKYLEEIYKEQHES